MPCAILLLSLFTLLAFNPAAARDADDGRNYLAIQANYANMDSDRRVDGSGLGAAFTFGYRVSNDWGYEVRLTGLVLERGEDSGTDFYQQDLGVDAIYRFARFDGWQPFALAGLSVIRNDVDLDELDETNAGVHLGIGITGGTLGGTGLRWRFDARYVHDEYLDGRQDIRIGAGIEIPFGRSDSGESRPSRQRTLNQDDSDQDSVADFLDQCPASLPELEYDENGCMLPDQTFRMVEVEFQNGTSILTTAARHELGKLVRALRGQPELRVEVVGHTDSVGEAGMNQQLSLERAEAVATFLVLQGIPTQRISVDGYGESLPIADNNTAEGRRRNRRIEINLLEPPAR